MTLSTSAVAVCCCSDLAQFTEQPRVLDRDDRLRGEVLHQLDLLIGEWPHLLAIDANCANQLAVLEHRDDEQRPCAGKFWRCRSLIVDVGRAPRRRRASARCLVATARHDRALGPGRMTGSRIAIRRIPRGASCRAAARKPRRRAATAIPNRLRRCGSHSPASLEYRLQARQASRNDLQHFRSRGLLLSDSRSSLSSRVFSMAMTAWAAKFCTSSICFSVKGRTSWR